MGQYLPKAGASIPLRFRRRARFPTTDLESFHSIQRQKFRWRVLIYCGLADAPQHFGFALGFVVIDVR
jgi:hypothetical protein